MESKRCNSAEVSGPCSVVGIATGWTVRGSNPGRVEIFRTCPNRSSCPPILLYNGYRVFLGGKEWPGRDADPSPPSSAVGHERVELYLYSPYGPYGLYRASVPVQGWPLPLRFTIWRKTSMKPDDIISRRNFILLFRVNRDVEFHVVNKFSTLHSK